MKATRVESYVPTYPWLGICKDERRFVVLFVKPCSGTVVETDGKWPLGSYHDNWSEKYFEPFQGSITLSN